MTTRRYGNLYPFLGATLTYLLLALWYLKRNLAATAGAQPFIVDDAYIHASLAKNLLLHGALSISPTGFSSASSSIGWPFLLALCFAGFSIHLWVLLALNALFAILTLYVADKIIRELAGQELPWARLVTLCLMIVAGSLVVMTFVGMEHNLQILSILLLVRTAIRVVASPRGGELALCLFGILAVITRYEAVFAVMVVFAILLAHRRIRLAFVFATVSALPVILFSAYGFSRGALILPNSLLLKSSATNWWHLFPAITGSTQYILFVFSQGATFLVLFVLVILLDLIGGRKLLSAPGHRVLLYFAAGLLFLHFQFAKTGWATRYEAYLIGLSIVCWGVLAISTAMKQASPSRRFQDAFVLMFVLLILLVPRISLSEHTISGGSRQIYMQQFQIARFLGGYFPRQTVAINDIGIISYWQPRQIVDVFGLASPEITRLKLAGNYNSSTLSQIVNREGVKIAVVYSDWLGSRLPGTWNRVGTWTLPPLDKGEAPLVAEMSVSFYAVNNQDVDVLKSALSSYSPCLPSGIIQEGYPTSTGAACTAAAQPQGWIW